MLGRIVRTTFVLRYAHDPKMRDRVQLQLNRGEGRHALSKRISFGNQGVFRTGDRKLSDWIRDILNVAAARARPKSKS